MKIVKNKELDQYFSRCDRNLSSDIYNEYLGLFIDTTTEKKVVSELKKKGAYEFKQGLESLYLSTQEFLKNPYYQNIELKNLKQGEFEYGEVKILANEIFNYSEVQNDPNMEFNDYLQLRALDEDYNAQVLFQNKEFWMMNVPSESSTIDPYALKGSGNVITFGLGIGYFVYMALCNPRVESVTVIEKSQEVVDLFNQSILPQFELKDKVKIIVGDGKDYFNEEFLNDFDYIFVDIWKSSDDGLYWMNQLLPQYLGSLDRLDFWIEDSCVEVVRVYMYIYLKCIYFGSKLPKISHKLESEIFQKIIKYFKQSKILIEDEEILKNTLYSRAVIREILSK